MTKTTTTPPNENYLHCVRQKQWCWITPSFCSKDSNPSCLIVVVVFARPEETLKLGMLLVVGLKNVCDVSWELGWLYSLQMRSVCVCALQTVMCVGFGGKNGFRGNELYFCDTRNTLLNRSGLQLKFRMFIITNHIYHQSSRSPSYIFFPCFQSLGVLTAAAFNHHHQHTAIKTYNLQPQRV